MATRATTAIARFCAVVSPLVGGHCYPAVRKRGRLADLPAVLYYATSPETVETFAGPVPVGLGLRIEIHARTYEELIDVHDRILAAIKPQAVRLGGGIDDYDEDVKIFRRIQGVTLGP